VVISDRRALLGQDFVDVGAVAVLLGSAASEFGENLVVDEEVAGGAFGDAVAEGVVAVSDRSNRARQDAGEPSGEHEVVASVPDEGVAGLGRHLTVAVVGVGLVAGGSRSVHVVEGAGFGSAVQGLGGGVADEVEAPATGLSAIVLRVEAVHGVEGGVPRVKSH